ncbi:MAG: histidine kinase [Burkholderiales bacterium]
MANPSRTLDAFRGLTWKRFAILCALLLIPATGQAIARALIPGKPVAYFAQVFAFHYVNMLLLFGVAFVVVIVAGNRAPSRAGPRMLTLLVAAMIGLTLGYAIAGGVDTLLFPVQKHEPATLIKRICDIVLWSHVTAAAVVGYYFLTREEEIAAQLYAEEKRRTELDRDLAEARVQVMRAQIEPHFLFNTLANVRRLINTDSAAAKAMLGHLTQYLSAMLPRMRSARSTLGDELAFALAYLNVHEIRMGTRLTVRTDVDPALSPLAFPPMMLVTLVENAIRHGITPVPEGGEVRIVARRTGATLRVDVVDTGRGLSESSGAGVGLANIRARLATLYDGGARLKLTPNSPRGVVATIEVPVEVARSDAAEALA